MRTEKTLIAQEYVARLNASPFFIVVDYTGLKVGPITELRKRLEKAGAQIHVGKNSLFRLAAKATRVPGMHGGVGGQIGRVSGQKGGSRGPQGVQSTRRECSEPQS